MTNEDIKYLAMALPEGITCLRYAGMYKEEIKAIDALLKKDDIFPALRKRLELERVFALGLQNDYTMTFDEALERMQQDCPEITADELWEMVYDGRADWRLNEGKICFQNSFISSSHINSPFLYDRSWHKTGYVEGGNRMMDKMKSQGSVTLRHHIRHTITIDKAAQCEGKRVLVHIPLPIKTDAQTNINIISYTAGAHIADEEAYQRTASFDAIYHEGDEYSVEYTFDIKMNYTAPEAEGATTIPDFTGEEYPHIRFTPYLRELCAALIGDETNPLKKARIIYDYVTTHLKYSYMREYLFLDNIPEFAALNGRGDCGVQALLFITLCRIAGVSAQWQSGFSLHETYVGSHDWARYYIAPYGWLYADLSSGSGAFRRGDEVARDFYFSNVDPMRMAANSRFQAEFEVPKKYLRCDPYDNQSGEVETDERGLDFGEYHAKREMLGITEL